MTQLEMVQHLSMAHGNPAAATALAQAILGDSRFPALMASAELVVEGPKAKGILDFSRESGLASLAASAPSGALAAEAWKIRYLAQEMRNLREDAVRRLVPLLVDRDLLPEGFRRCDMAYILCSRFLVQPTAPDFLKLSEKERNAAIDVLRKSEVLEELS